MDRSQTEPEHSATVESDVTVLPVRLSVGDSEAQVIGSVKARFRMEWHEGAARIAADPPVGPQVAELLVLAAQELLAAHERANGEVSTDAPA